MVTKLSWLVNYVHGSDIALPGPELVKSKPTEKLYGKLQVPSGLGYVPLSLEFMSPFRAAVARNQEESRSASGRRFAPYSCKIDGDKHVEVTITGRVYEPRIIVLRVSIETDLGMTVSDLAGNPSFISIREHAEIDSLVRSVLSLIVNGTLPDGHGTGVLRYDQYPIVDISEIESDHFPTWQELHKQEIARILIRNTADGRMRDELVDKLFVKSEQFNFKTNSAYLLLDKQGIVSVAAKASDAVSEEARKKTIKSASYLVELALVFRSFLDNFLQLRHEHVHVADYLYSRVVPWCTNPSAVLRRSVTGLHLWQLIVSELRVPETFALVASRDYVQIALSSKLEAYDQVAISGEYWLSQLQRVFLDGR